MLVIILVAAGFVVGWVSGYLGARCPNCDCDHCGNYDLEDDDGF